MSGPDGLILFLPEAQDAPPLWTRIVDGAAVQSGEGATWLAACGMAQIPAGTTVMLVPPAAQTVLHWIAHPDLPARQGRAAARLTALAGGIAPSDQLFAVADENDDPAVPHRIAVASRADMQHWLLWAQHHGLDPDLIVPAALLLPEPEGEAFIRGHVGGGILWRGAQVAWPEDLALPELVGDGPVADAGADAVQAATIAALEQPPLNMRRGDYARRTGRTVDSRALGRIALWSGLILLTGLLIALVGIAKQYREASRLDAQSVALAGQVLPQASDAVEALAGMEAQLAARGAGARAFAAPVAALMSAMQDAPGVALTSLSRDPDGMIRATLAAAKADDINIVLLALQAAGYRITATPAQEPGGRTLADITVRS